MSNLFKAQEDYVFNQQIAVATMLQYFKFKLKGEITMTQLEFLNAALSRATNPELQETLAKSIERLETMTKDNEDITGMDVYDENPSRVSSMYAFEPNARPIPGADGDRICMRNVLTAVRIAEITEIADVDPETGKVAPIDSVRNLENCESYHNYATFRLSKALESCRPEEAEELKAKLLCLIQKRNLHLLAPNSVLSGTVVSDGHIFNPYIHRTWLPSQVLHLIGLSVGAAKAIDYGNKGEALFVPQLANGSTISTMDPFRRYMNAVIRSLAGVTSVSGYMYMHKKCVIDDIGGLHIPFYVGQSVYTEECVARQRAESKADDFASLPEERKAYRIAKRSGLKRVTHGLAGFLATEEKVLRRMNEASTDWQAPADWEVSNEESNASIRPDYVAARYGIETDSFKEIQEELKSTMDKLNHSYTQFADTCIWELPGLEMYIRVGLVGTARGILNFPDRFRAIVDADRLVDILAASKFAHEINGGTDAQKALSVISKFASRELLEAITASFIVDPASIVETYTSRF